MQIPNKLVLKEISIGWILDLQIGEKLYLVIKKYKVFLFLKN